MNTSTLDFALAYAGKLPGRLLPVAPGGKRPVLNDWTHQASCDEAALRRWFERTPNNIGWTPDPGVIVLDIDTKPDDSGRNGFDTVAGLQAQFGPLPRTLTAATPTGGRHLLFRCDPSLPVKSIVGGKVGFSGLDIRASSGQIVLAPSTRPEGRYMWAGWDPLDEDAPEIAQAPQWLIHFACGALKPGGTVAPATRREARKVGDDSGKVRAGGRNAALVAEAGALRRRGWGYDAIVEALTALSEMQFEPPSEDKEIAGVARWACGFSPDEDADIAAARGADEWADLLDGARGDAGEVVAVARRIKADPALSRTETEALLKRAAKSAGVAVKTLRADLWQPGGDGDVRATIQVRRSDFAGSVDSAMSVLPSVPGLRVRSGQLVEVVRHGKGGAIAPVVPARLAYLLSSRSRWDYGEGGDGAPDVAVLQALMAAGHWPGVPEIEGLLHQPSIAPNGDILADAGNHAGMEAQFDPRAWTAYEGEGVEALGELRALLRDFPFASELDESAALAAILTAVARPMLPTAPAFLIRAHDLGTGKSYLAELIASFADADVMMRRWAQRGEEQDKTLLAALIEGRPSCVFDNLTCNWQSPTLAAILTSGRYSDRVLGTSSSASVSTRCLYLASGNNVSAVKDLSRRVVTVELDARCEKPAERKFAADPVAEVQKDRERWVMCALRVLQAFLQSGEPPALPPLASYGEWSRIVRGALVHFGLPDPVRAVTRNIERDDDRDMLAHILQTWRDAFGDEPMTLREVLQTSAGRTGVALTDLRVLFLEVGGERGEIDLRRLGHWFAARAGRVVGGLRLVGGERTRKGVAWRVNLV